MKGFFDTNILIDFLNGAVPAREEVEAYDETLISRITWMEVLVGASNENDEHVIRLFLRRFRVIELTDRIAEHAIELRRTRRLKMPDAIILASALSADSRLITRNTRDFCRTDPAIRVPYEL